jgi:hypothetical protein
MVVVGIALGGTERSLATLVGLLLGGQFVLHAMFAAAQYGQGLGHGGDMAPSADGTAMTVAHVGVAALSAWWLRRGERAVWGLARRVAAALLGPALALLSVLPPPDAPPRRRRIPPSAARARPALLRHIVVRRGPPSPRAALA